MAGYREHISVSGLCGIAFGAAATFGLGFTPVQAALAGVLTWVGGMLPDLDADGGRPVREISALVGAVVPMIVIRRLVRLFGSVDAAILVAVILYALIRYGGATLIRRCSVHRGMFHSIPALLISAELVYLGYLSEDKMVKLLMAGGVAIGFLSHLILDELYSVQWSGVRVKLKRSAGSALKVFGKAAHANIGCFGFLGLLTWLTLIDTGLVVDPYDQLRTKHIHADRMQADEELTPKTGDMFQPDPQAPPEPLPPETIPHQPIPHERVAEEERGMLY